MINTLKVTLVRILKIVAWIFFAVIILGYSYTFYKEYIHTFTTPSALQKISTQEGDLAYLAYGDSKNQPIVLFHGTGANAFIWDKTSLFLASHGYYVISVDLPPFGWSFIPKAPQDYKKETQAKRVVTLLARLSLKNPIIIGHSYNSKVALLVASSFPSREIIFIAPVLSYDEKEDPGIIGTLASISLLRDPLLSLFVNNTLLAKNVLFSFMYKKDVDVASVLATTILPFNKKGVNHAYGEWFQEFFNETSIVSDSETLKLVTVPVKVLWGNEDTISPKENFTKLQKLSPSASISIIPGVGHMPHLEDTIPFNTLLLKVLQR